VVTGAVDARRGSDFAGLCRQVRAARLLERRRGDYAARIAVTGLAFAALWWMFAVVGESWYTSHRQEPSKTIQQKRAAQKLKLEQAARRDIAAAIRDR
jgi:hypothetical protein